MRVKSVLFDDGRSVSEKEAQSLAIHEAVGDSVQEHVNQQWKYLKIVGAITALTVTLGMYFVFVAFGMVQIGAALIGIGVVAGVGGGAYIRSRNPDVTVQSVEKGYWTGYLVPDEGGTVVFDATESIEKQHYQLDLLKDPDSARVVEETLDSMQDFPVVMTDETNVEESFVDALSDVESAIENSESHEIRAPVLQDDDPAVDALSELTSMAGAEPIDAGGVSLSREEATEQVQTFKEFESMADEDHGESVLLNVSERSRELSSELSNHQKKATRLLNDHIQTAGDMFGKISYHFYCPDCMEDDIESQLEIIDNKGEWHCETCRSDFPPGEGVPRHRIRDDIILDVWDQLWIEKDDERRQIYESIEDQKSELEEREFEQCREEIRTTEERIKDIRSKIRDLQTEAKAKQGVVEEIGKLMVKYERLNEQKKEEFHQDVTEAFDQIDAETEKVLEETEGIIEDRIEEAEEEAEQRAEMMREEERQREREKVAYEQARADQREIAAQQRADKRTIATLEAINKTHGNKPSRKGR